MASYTGFSGSGYATQNLLASPFSDILPNHPNALLSTANGRTQFQTSYSGQPNALTIAPTDPASTPFNALMSAQAGTLGGTIRATMPNPPGTYRGQLLPMMVDQAGNTSWAVPEMARSFLGGLVDLLDCSSHDDGRANVGNVGRARIARQPFCKRVYSSCQSSPSFRG